MSAAFEYVLRSPEDVSAIRNDLKRDGVAVVKLYDEDAPIVEDYERGMHNLAFALRDDGATASGARGMGGVTKLYAAGCHKAAARVRLDPAARGVHASIYGVATETVMSSWDAVGILGDDAVRKAARVPSATVAHDTLKGFAELTGSNLPPHVDVGINSAGARMEERMKMLHPDFHACLQSQFVCKTVVPGGATLVVSPGPWYDRPRDPTLFDYSKGKDYCRITEAGLRALHGTWRAVEAPRGSLILWISALPHTNKWADVGVDPRRLVVYISWQSRQLVAAEERASLKRKKLETIMTGGTTDHWSTHVPKMHRGGHYSNGLKKTKVLFSAANPPSYDAELLAQIHEAM